MLNIVNSPKDNHPFRKRFIYLAVLLVFLTGALLIIIKFWYKTPAISPSVVVEGNKPPIQSSNPLKQVEIDKNKLPAKFPIDLPIETGVEVVQNYEVPKPEGGFQQSTRSYLSNKNLTELETVYTQYFKQNGWKQVSRLEQTGYRVMSVTKDDLLIQVSFTLEPLKNQSIVEITLSPSPNIQ